MYFVASSNLFSAISTTLVRLDGLNHGSDFGLYIMTNGCGMLLRNGTVVLEGYCGVILRESTICGKT